MRGVDVPVGNGPDYRPCVARLAERSERLEASGIEWLEDAHEDLALDQVVSGVVDRTQEVRVRSETTGGACEIDCLIEQFDASLFWVLLTQVSPAFVGQRAAQ